MSPSTKAIVQGFLLGFPSALLVTYQSIRLYPTVAALFVGLLIMWLILAPIGMTAAFAGQRFATWRPGRFQKTALVTVMAAIVASLAVNALLRLLLPRFTAESLLGDIFCGLVTGGTVMLSLTKQQVKAATQLSAEHGRAGDGTSGG